MRENTRLYLETELNWLEERLDLCERSKKRSEGNLEAERVARARVLATIGDIEVDLKGGTLGKSARSYLKNHLGYLEKDIAEIQKRIDYYRKHLGENAVKIQDILKDMESFKKDLEKGVKKNG